MGKQNMPLERWVKAAEIEVRCGLALLIDSPSDSSPISNFEDDEDSDDEEENESDIDHETIITLELEHDLLCNEMQRILLDSCSANRPESPSVDTETHIDSPADGRDDIEEYGEATENLLPMLNGEVITEWEVRQAPTSFR
jgi:hypothetical protein